MPNPQYSGSEGIYHRVPCDVQLCAPRRIRPFPMLTIAHLITGLETGGAERMLARLVTTTDPGRFRSLVISMGAPGPVGLQIEAAGVPVHSLGMRRGGLDPRPVLRLTRILRNCRPDILQTWLPHADLFGVLARSLRLAPRLLWNIRATEMLRASVVRMLLARLSRIPDAVIVNSQAGERYHQGLGYRPRRWVQISNGFDTDALRPDAAARERQRRGLGLADDTIAVLLPARYHPVKDHTNFLAAAALLAARRPEMRFAMAGAGIAAGNRALDEAIAAHGLGSRLLLLGERHDLDTLYSAFDIVTLSSAIGEGFPNVLGEAMCCGIPCAATDSGDAASIVGDTGEIVPPRDPAALAAAWERIAALDPAARHALGLAARQRIVRHYALPSIVARYEAVYEAIAAT